MNILKLFFTGERSQLLNICGSPAPSVSSQPTSVLCLHLPGLGEARWDGVRKRSTESQSSGEKNIPVSRKKKKNNISQVQRHRSVSAPVLAHFWYCVCLRRISTWTGGARGASSREGVSWCASWQGGYMWVCVSVCACMIGNFSLPFPPGIISFTAVVFCFLVSARRYIEKTHSDTRAHTAFQLNAHA